MKKKKEEKRWRMSNVDDVEGGRKKEKIENIIPEKRRLQKRSFIREDY